MSKSSAGRAGSAAVILENHDVFAKPYFHRGEPYLPVRPEPDARAAAALVEFTATLTSHSELFMTLRLHDDRDVVGVADLVSRAGQLVMTSAAAFRSSSTTDWAVHFRAVTEALLRSAGRVADERGMAVATAPIEPEGLLAEFGFEPVGELWRRERGMFRGEVS